MLQVQTFICNPYQENTYILFDEKGSCAIVDPGMYTKEEQEAVVSFIKGNNLNPELLLNTHCHVDHVLANRFVFDTYGLVPQFHEGELPLLIEVQNYAPQMGIQYEISPIPEIFLGADGDVIVGDETLQIIFAPGHSPAHLCFYHKEQGLLIGGDVLFKDSIGRTDLPGGDYKELIASISQKLYTLPDDTIVYPGHGPSTTIGAEKSDNPFIKG